MVVIVDDDVGVPKNSVVANRARQRQRTVVDVENNSIIQQIKCRSGVQ